MRTWLVVMLDSGVKESRLLPMEKCLEASCMFEGMDKLPLRIPTWFLLKRIKMTIKTQERMTRTTTRDDMVIIIPSSSGEMGVGGWSTGVGLSVTPTLLSVVVCIETSP